MSLQSVLANLTAYGIAVPKACHAEMDMHIQRSLAYAKGNHRWQDQGQSGALQQTSGGATSNLRAQTESRATEIESVIRGDIMTNVYLERAWFFQGRYKILEEARANNIGLLWAAIRRTLSGTGFGLRVGK